MPTLIWLNGEIVPFSQATINIEDRGFQFADGVYEVIRLYAGRPYTLAAHLARLDRSAKAIGIPMPLSPEQLAAEIRRFIPQAGAGEGMIYLQLSRGVAPRNHIFPPASETRPTLLFYDRPLPPIAAVGKGEPVKLSTQPDDRWRRCWIKSTALLANVLAKNAAVAQGADEAIFLDPHDNTLSECSASNFFAVINGKLITHPVGPKVLRGITRDELILCARELNIPIEERPLPINEARSADELFISSTTREIATVSHWDDQPVKKNHGPITTRLHHALKKRVEADLAR